MAAAVAQATDAPGIVLKGPAISDRLYPDPGLRPYNDLDLLVARRALQDAKAALSAIGYEARIQSGAASRSPTATPSTWFARWAGSPSTSKFTGG